MFSVVSEQSPAPVSVANGTEPREVVYIGYVGGLGGEANQLFDLAAGVASRGVAVTVVVPDLPGTRRMAAEYEQANLRVVLSPLIRFDQPGGQKFSDVWKLHRAFRAPVVHLHTGDICVPRVNLLVLMLQRGFNVFATIHSAYPDMAVGGSRARLWAQAVRSRFSRIICPSGHGRDAQIAYGLPPARVQTVYNAIDTPRFAQGDGQQARAALNVGPDVPLVIATARLHPQKRPLDSVDAFARIAPDFPDVRLVLVGNGPLEAEVRARIAGHGLESRVNLMGHQQNVPDWLAAADVWLCTSDAENFSLSVLEAMAAGCAIVGTFCRGNDEILKNGENALTAPVGDINELAAGLRRLLITRELRMRLQAGARETVTHFDRERMIDRHLELYRGNSAATQKL